MTKLMGMFGSYSYRLTRKHSTILLIALFIVILTAVLQLYAFKHQEMPNLSAKVSDYEYVPGAFLKGQQPNENGSYCQFNYGLPKLLEWKKIKVVLPPGGVNGSHWNVIYNAIEGTAYANHSKYDAVTYATHATPEFLYHITEIARYWDGPISVAVFAPDFDMDITMQIMTQLCSCYSAMSKVSLHLFYPKGNPPKMRIPLSYYMSTEVPTTANTSVEDELFLEKLKRFMKVTNKTRIHYKEYLRKRKIEDLLAKMTDTPLNVPQLMFSDCAGMDLSNIPTFRKEKQFSYQINVGRNVARNASRTNYFIVSDIELVPSDGLAPKFLTMLRKLMGDKKRDEGRIFSKTVFVVPIFEVEKGVEIPRDKDTLVRLINENRAKYFHQNVCAHCQRFPGLQSWLIRPSNNVVEPMLIARREYPYHRWEPLYFGTQNDPWYNELLTWEGRQEKMSQMLEMCLQEYRMVILDGAFLCHAATEQRYLPGRSRSERYNHLQYLGIVSAFKEKYQNIPKCKLMYGC